MRNPKKTVVVQYAPAISVSLAEEFNLEPGKDINGILNSALRKIGFDKVFDTSFSADLTIIEESSELIHRVQNNGVLPMFTSCCPAWVKYIEEFYPEMIPHLSSCKSPMQMLGSVIKSHWADTQKIDSKDIYSVAIMPCTAKKFEAQREEMTQNGISDIDAVLTTRELGQLIRTMGIDMHNIEEDVVDSPLGFRSSAGKLFGTTGGVMEAAIRTAYFKISGNELKEFKIPAIRGLEGRKELKLDIEGLKLGVAVVNGLGNAAELITEIKEGRNDIHFVEVMTCPGGCINGGGQYIGASQEGIRARMTSLYEIDEKDPIKVSYKNPEIIELYNQFLGEPLGEKSHHLLHTKYNERDVLK